MCEHVLPTRASTCFLHVRARYLFVRARLLFKNVRPGEHLCFHMSVLSLDKVVGGPNDSIIFVTLGPGVCFGEIALLGTGGMNRRTASNKVNIQMQNLSSDF